MGSYFVACPEEKTIFFPSEIPNLRLASFLSKVNKRVLSKGTPRTDARSTPLFSKDNTFRLVFKSAT